MMVKEINQSINHFLQHTPLFNDQIIDAAFLGSFSGHYGWKETAFGDCDIWLYCNSIQSPDTWDHIYFFLEALREHLQMAYPQILTVYEVAYGPYKPAVDILDQELLFLHITVDDQRSYELHSDFTKLSWSKYPCYRNRGLLANLLVQNSPFTLDLYNAKFGISDGLTNLQERTVEIRKYDFSKKCMRTFSYHFGNHVFSEYMLYLAMTNARNYFRAKGCSFADAMPNDAFVQEFCRITKIESLIEIYRIKKRAERLGYGVISQQTLLEAVYAFLNQLNALWKTTILIS